MSQIYWATRQLWNIEHPIALNISYLSFTDKNYTRPNETLVFSLAAMTDTAEAVTFAVDFGDGTAEITSDATIGFVDIFNFVATS